MRVAILLDVDNRTGGSVAADRLTAGLMAEGHNVRRFARFVHGTRSAEEVVAYSRARRTRIGMRLTPPALRDNIEKAITARWTRASLSAFRPDVINIHSFVMARTSLPFSLTEICYGIAPTVWTLHDMWTFTGRCTYSEECRKFVTGCDASCPTPNEFPALDPSRIAGEWLMRKRALDLCPDIAAISPSRWLAKEAVAGVWKGHRVEVIPYGLPLQVFRPLPRDAARQMLGIEAKGPVVLCGAWALEDKRKGIDRALAALKNRGANSLTLVTMGRGAVQWNEGPCFPLGFIDDDRLKAIAYSAADLYLHPALADNLPNMVLESLACGTPVVSFPVGGLPDMVRPGVTGWLADDMSVGALRSALDSAIRDREYGVTLRKECREVAELEYPENLQSRRYSSLFTSLITRTAPSMQEDTAPAAP